MSLQDHLNKFIQDGTITITGDITLPNIDQRLDDLIGICKSNESYVEEDEEGMLSEHPAGNILLIEAVLYLIKEQGIQSKDNNHILNHHAINLLRKPAILDLCYKSQRFLVKEINRILREKEEEGKKDSNEAEHRRIKGDIKEKLNLIDENNSYELIGEIFAYIQRCTNGYEFEKAEDGQKQLNSLLERIPLENKRTVLAKLHKLIGDKWEFIYPAHMYCKHNRLMKDADESAFNEQMNHAGKTIEEAQSILKWSKTGMIVGGMALGVEVIMFGLEIAGYAMSVGAMISLAAVIFGFALAFFSIGRYFYWAHFNELKKHTLETTYEEKIGDTEKKEWGAAHRWAFSGVAVESVFTFGAWVGLLALFCDSVTRVLGAGSGSVLDSIPLMTTYGAISNPILAAIVIGFVACAIVGIAGWISYSLAKGHMALDGEQAKNAYEQEVSDELSRSFIPSCDTNRPLCFSRFGKHYQRASDVVHETLSAGRCVPCYSA